MSHSGCASVDSAVAARRALLQRRPPPPPGPLRPAGSEASTFYYCALAAHPRPATPSTVCQPSAGPPTTELHNFGVNHFLGESAVPVYQARTCEQGTVGTRP